MRALIGTSGYNYPEWRGSFYPEKISAKKMLSYYAERFDTVEINYTFRTVPTENVLHAWAAQVPPGFQFSLKAPQAITHHRRLVDVADDVREFARLAALLGKQQAPTLFQLPPNFKIDLPRLKAFLTAWPKRARAAFEFRHASWFCDETYALLKRAGVALSIADTDDLSTPVVTTAPFGYFRLRRIDYNPKAITRWAREIERASDGDVYVYFKHEEGARGPVFAQQLRQRLVSGPPEDR